MTERITSYSNGPLRFDVTDSGPVDGPVVVLLHGFPTGRESWAAVASELAAAGIRTLAPDQRGYSPDASPPRRRDYHLADLVEDVIALLDRIAAVRPGTLVHLVGHDWGGAVAWAVAAAAPARLSALTVLSTPHPAAMAEALRSSDQALRSSYMVFFQLPIVPEIILGRGLPRFLAATGLPPTTAARYARAMEAPGRLRSALNWYRALPLPDDRRREGSHGGKRIAVPTTLVAGRRDRFFSRRAIDLSGRHVDAHYRLIVLDENHWLPELAADRVSAEIIGLSGHPAV